MPNVSRRPSRDDDEEPDEKPRSRRRDADDDEEERPARRRARDDDEEEERPARRRSRDRDDDDEEEKPARRRPRDDDEEERPARRRARDDDDEEPEEKPRRSRARDDDEEDEKPKRNKARRDDDDDPEDDEKDGRTKRSTARGGWDGYNQNKSESSEFADEWEPGAKPDLIKFLDDEPVTTYRQHWVDHPPAPHRKKSWICLGKDNDCPMCDMGDRPRVLSVFNILVLTQEGGDICEQPLNKIVVLGVKATGQVKNLAEDRKTGPLTRHYYGVSKGGKDAGYAWNWRPVKERDLEDDWKVEPLTDKEITKAEARMWDVDDIVQIPTRKLLKEIAKGLTDEDGD